MYIANQTLIQELKLSLVDKDIEDVVASNLAIYFLLLPSSQDKLHMVTTCAWKYVKGIFMSPNVIRVMCTVKPGFRIIEFRGGLQKFREPCNWIKKLAKQHKAAYNECSFVRLTRIITFCSCVSVSRRDYCFIETSGFKLLFNYISRKL